MEQYFSLARSIARYSNGFSIAIKPLSDLAVESASKAGIDPQPYLNELENLRTEVRLNYTVEDGLKKGIFIRTASDGILINTRG